MTGGRVTRLVKSIGMGFKEDFQDLVILMLVLLGIGTVFYSIVEGWSYLDSFYFSAVTLTTVGFGDVVPHTAAGKLFTVLYAFIGIGVIFGFFSLVGVHARGGKK